MDRVPHRHRRQTNEAILPYSFTVKPAKPWLADYFILLKISLAACCKSGLRTMTFEIALRSLALLSLALEVLRWALTAACRSLFSLIRARIALRIFSAFASDRFGPLFVMPHLHRAL